MGGRFATSLGRRGRTCHAGDPAQADALKEGAPDAYAKVLAHHVGFDAPDPERRLALAADARAKVLDLTDSHGFGGVLGFDWNGWNQCILDLALSIPIWIETALLLEATPVWSDGDRSAFAGWLAGHVYPRVAWASRVRRNNWGAAGSLAASAIARYVAPEGLALREVAPAERRLQPAAAWREHDARQRARIATVWRGDSECRHFGIQDHGGIPDELRRGAAGCGASSLPSGDDPSLTYQTMHVELLVFHAEMLRRTGDRELFDATTAAGDPALLRAILFVIDNPTPGARSWPWGTRRGALAVAHRAYADPRLLEAARAAKTFRGGRTLPYAGLGLGAARP